MLFDINGIFSIEIAGTNKRLLQSIYDDLRIFQTDETTEADLNILVTDVKPPQQDCYLVERKYYIKEDSISCRDSYKTAKWNLTLDNVTSRPTVYFNGNIFSGFFLKEFIIEPLIALKLANKGFSALHASGIALNQNGFVFPACKGVGKTNTLIYAAEDGASYLSNERCIIANDGLVYGYPSDINLYYYNTKNDYLSNQLSYRDKLGLLLNNLIYRLSFRYASFPLSIDPIKLFGKIESKVPLSSLILLTKTNKDRVQTKQFSDKTDLIVKLVLINAFEMSYLFNLLEKYSYVFSETNMVSEYRRSLKDNLTKALEKVPCFEVEIPRTYDPKVYLSICKLIKKDFDDIV
jgi:hypothetical protein